jgi:hypothetical protein
MSRKKSTVVVRLSEEVRDYLRSRAHPGQTLDGVIREMIQELERLKGHEPEK